MIVIEVTVLWNSDVRPSSAVICYRLPIADIVFVAWWVFFWDSSHINCESIAEPVK